MSNAPPIATSRRADAWAIVAAVVIPSIVTWVYFVALREYPLPQKIAYNIGKTVQFVLPVVWVLAFQRQRPAWRWPRSAGLAEGIVFGAVVFAAMLVGYYAWLGPQGYLSDAAKEITAVVQGFGVRGPAGFLALGAFYSVVHSLLEEYYWRWFVFGQMRRLMPLGLAVAASALAFMAHHVIVLLCYFGWQSPATWVFSLCVAAGGAAWAWIYHRSQSLLGPWLSHLLVDAAIFVVGYDLVRQTW